MSSGVSSQHFVPSPDIVTTIVLPTILFCIMMVVGMLIGINKCKQWELDKIVEMRRTRRVIQRITARLQEKNFRTIQKARHMRKRAVAAAKNNMTTSTTASEQAPPLYNPANAMYPSGTSPPPTYEDSLWDQLYQECMPVKDREFCAGSSRKLRR